MPRADQDARLDLMADWSEMVFWTACHIASAMFEWESSPCFVDIALLESVDDSMQRVIWLARYNRGFWACTSRQLASKTPIRNHGYHWDMRWLSQSHMERVDMSTRQR